MHPTSDPEPVTHPCSVGCAPRTISTLRQNGYIMLPVVLAISLLAVLAFMMNHENAIEINNASGELEAEQARYAAETGLNHGLWQIGQNGCGPYSDITDAPFGNHSYSATITPNNAGGQITTYSVPVSDDAYIKEDTPTQNYGNDAQLSTFYKLFQNQTQRTLYRFDIENSGIPAGAQIVSAVAKIFIIDSNDNFAVNVHQVTADWTEGTVNWDNIANNHDSTALASIPSGSPVGQYVAVNITPLVQGWVNGSTMNQGIMLKTTFTDDLAQYTSKEYGTVDQRPLLEVKISDGTLSNRASITAQGTLTNGVTRSVTRDDLVLYQATPNTLELQPGAAETEDTYIYQWQSDWNHGAHVNLVAAHQANAVRHALLRFNLTGVPAGARVTSANLELYSNTTAWAGTTIDAHRLNNDWVEGDETGGTGDGANWTERDTGSLWNTAGGDYEASPAANAVTSGNTGWVTWDVTDLVSEWVSGKAPNHGLLLAPTVDYQGAEFDSSDSSDFTTHPKLTITYTCECGIACLAPQGSGNVLLAVGDAVTVDSDDAYKRLLFEEWGYRVSLIDDDDDQAAFDTAFANNDVAYISETVSSWMLGDKLNAATIGVVNEEGDLTDNLGTSSSRTYSVGRSLSILDNSHYITELFPLGVMPVYHADMDGLSAAGTLATDLQTLADRGGAPGLAFVETGGILHDGSSIAPGRRVMLPIGRDSTSNFNWRYLNNNGRLIVQRAIQWGSGSTGSCTDGNFRDEFNANEFNNSDGTLDWSGEWIDTDKNGVGPVAGYVLATKGELRLNGPVNSGNDPSVYREADLTSYQSVNLSFDFRTGSGNEAAEDSAVVEVSGDGGSSWTVLEDFINEGPSASGTRSYDITPYIAANTRIRFRIDAAYGGPNEYFYVDNVNINASCAPPPSCNADYTPDTKISEFSTSSYGSGFIKGITYLPEGMIFKGITSPAGGAWLSVDSGSDKVLMTDMAGALLTEISTPGTSPTGIAYISTGLFADHLAISDYFDNSTTITDMAGNIVISLSATGLSYPVGVAYIETTTSGTHDDTLAILDVNGKIGLISQNGTPVSTLDFTGIVNQVEDIVHLPGTDALLLLDRGEDVVFKVGLSGSVEKLYVLNGFGSSAAYGIAINSETCDHVIGDLGVDKVIALNQGSMTSPPVSCDGTYRDEFNVQQYDLNDGTLNWTTNWEETGEITNPTGGDIQIDSDAGNYQLLVRDDGQTIEREADLTGASSATLTFGYRRDNLGEGDYVAVEISSDGGSNWGLLDSFDGPGTDGLYTAAKYDISGYISPNTRIRFLTPNKGMDDATRVWFDNIRIQCSP